MRSSLGSAKKDDIKYPHCTIENHKNEAMNIVCIDSNCTQKGLICNLCKVANHAKHQVKPLKTFLKVFEDFEKNYKPGTLDGILNKLNVMYQNVLVTLRETVEKMAKAVRDFEVELITDFQNINDLLLIESANYKSLYQYAQIIKTSPKLEDLLLNVKKLLDSTRFDPVKKTIDVINTSDNIVLQYAQKEASYIQIMKHLQLQVITSLDHAKLETKNEKLKKSFFRFNDALKPSIIKLSESNLVARQTQSNNADVRFALVEPGLSLTECTDITFRVKNKTNWVGLGIALKNSVVDKKFKFNYSTIGHGSFLVSTNGYTWSHSRPEDNIKLKAFTFDTGSDIRITFDPTKNKLSYNNLEGDKVYELDVDLTELDKAGGINFCANLGSHGDQVKIVNRSY